MKIVFVAFDCKKDNSVMYKKIDISQGYFHGKIMKNDKKEVVLRLGHQLSKAIEKGADFCSVRFIK